MDVLLSPQAISIGAIVVNIFGNTIDSIGWVMQKKAHNQRKSTEFAKDVNWWIGFGIHSIGNVICRSSFAFGTASLLLSIDPIRIALTTAIAAKYLNENVFITQIIGIVVIMIGSAISTIFGPKEIETFINIEDIELLYQQLSFMIVAASITISGLFVYVMLKIFTNMPPFCRMLSLLFISATFGAWNILFLKCTLETITSSFVSYKYAKINATHWLSYVNLIGLIITVISIEIWRQRALLQFYTAYVTALFTVFTIGLGIGLSSTFFDEFKQLNIYELMLFFCGILFSFIGVALIAFDSNGNRLPKTRSESIPMQSTQSTLKYLALEKTNSDHILLK